MSFIKKCWRELFFIIKSKKKVHSSHWSWWNPTIYALLTLQTVFYVIVTFIFHFLSSSWGVSDAYNILFFTSVIIFIVNIFLTIVALFLKSTIFFISRVFSLYCDIRAFNMLKLLPIFLISVSVLGLHYNTFLPVIFKFGLVNISE